MSSIVGLWRSWERASMAWKRDLRRSHEKRAGILDSGLFDHEMVAGVRFELTTSGLCDLTQLSLRVGLYLHPVERDRPNRR